MRIDINYTSLAQKLKQKSITNLLEKKKGEQPSAAHRGSAHARQRPTAGRHARAPTLMQKSPQLLTKWTRSPFYYFTLSLWRSHLTPRLTSNSHFKVPGQILLEATASPAKRRRARTSSAAILTTVTILITSAFDRGNKYHDWCRTKAWPRTTAGLGHGDADAGELT